MVNKDSYFRIHITGKVNDLELEPDNFDLESYALLFNGALELFSELSGKSSTSKVFPKVIKGSVDVYFGSEKTIIEKIDNAFLQLNSYGNNAIIGFSKKASETIINFQKRQRKLAGSLH